MKIKHITLQNYKRFVQPQTFSFTDSDEIVNEKTLLVGNNGTGKSSILQAIVILLASAIRDHFNPNNQLEWPGFEYRHLQSGIRPLKIEAEILFLDEEIKTTQEYARQLKDKGIKRDKQPASNKSVTISFDDNKRQVFAKEGREAYSQFQGYQYAKTLARYSSQKNKMFENIGNIYWYTEQRNSNHITNLLESKINQLDDIRLFLASAYNYHTAVKDGRRQIQKGEISTKN